MFARITSPNSSSNLNAADFSARKNSSSGNNNNNNNDEFKGSFKNSGKRIKRRFEEEMMNATDKNGLHSMEDAAKEQQQQLVASELTESSYMDFDDHHQYRSIASKSTE